MTYAEICKQRCGWCQAGNEREGIYHFIEHEFRSPGGERYVPCTAPSAEALVEELTATPHPDTSRLDWLEARRVALNRHYGTRYGWKFVTSPNVNRLFVQSVNLLDLNDAQAKGTDIREAIDVAIASEAAND